VGKPSYLEKIRAHIVIVKALSTIPCRETRGVYIYIFEGKWRDYWTREERVPG